VPSPDFCRGPTVGQDSSASLPSNVGTPTREFDPERLRRPSEGARQLGPIFGRALTNKALTVEEQSGQWNTRSRRATRWRWGR